jgi:hypothetical protein
MKSPKQATDNRLKKLSDFNDISYVGRLWCPELIPDIKKFLQVAIFKMATTIPHNFSAVLWWPFWKCRLVEIFQCRESIRDIIIYPHVKCWWYRTMLNFYRPFFMPCFGSHFENGRYPWSCPRQISGTTGQNFMKLGGVIDICF